MYNHIPAFILSAFALFSLTVTANATDIEREKRIANSIKDSIVIGDVISLKAGETEFIGLLNNDIDIKPKGVTLILHGMGSNPNAPQVIQPLRDNLTEHGWATLAIQLPLLSNNASIEDYMSQIKESAPRIEASLNYMKENFANQPCTMVAHSLGAVMAVDYIASQEGLVCDALVLIGLPTLPIKEGEESSLDQLKKITIPVLDIYGSQDLPSVKHTAAVRKTNLLNNNSLNRQQQTPGADHAFTGLDEPLALTIHSWLSSVTHQP